MALYKLNYDQLISKFNDVEKGHISKTSVSYGVLSLKQKVLLVGAHLINKGL